MTRKIKHDPMDNKFIRKPGISVMMALETAVLLLEQNGETEEDIMKYVHMILRGFIRNGELAPEYLEVVNQVIAEKQAEAEAESRAQAIRDSILGNTK